MFQKIKIHFPSALPAIIISTLLAISIVYAWTEPSSSPPEGNVNAPLNIGDSLQMKSGPFIVHGVFETHSLTSLATQGGNVGIGMTPGYKLDVNGDLNIAGASVYRRGGTAGVSVSCGAGNTPSGIAVSGGIVISAGTCTAIGGGGVPGGANGNVQFNSYSTFGGDANLFWDNTNKRLGIGDSSPLASLTVGNGDLFRIDSTGNLIRIRNIAYSWPSAQGAASTYLKNDGSGNLSWQTVAGGGYSTIQNQGTSLTQRTTLNFTGAGVSCVDNAGSSRTDCAISAGGGVPGGANGYVQFNSSGSFGGDVSLFWDNTNKRLGIGDSSPLASLTVGNGDLFQVSSAGDIVKIKNISYVWPTSQGAANTVLTNDGSGNLIWVTPAGGGGGGGGGISGGNDIQFPDGVFGAQIIRWENYSTHYYTVPAGYTFYISSIWNTIGNPERIQIPSGNTNNFEMPGSTDLHFAVPLPVAGGTTIGGGWSSSYPLVLYGYLVPTNKATAVRAEIYTTAYTVPAGKTLYIAAIYNTSNGAYALKIPSSDLDNITLDGYELLKFPVPLPVASGVAIQGGSSANYPLVIYGYLAPAEGQKTYYLSTNTVNGAGAKTACASGYHMAGSNEMQLYYLYTYNSSLGGGAGPPLNTSGWIRNGGACISTQNCNCWTIGDSSGNGGTVRFISGWDSYYNIYVGGSNGCQTLYRVWCMQN